jgi:hypothetical protein
MNAVSIRVNTGMCEAYCQLETTHLIRSAPIIFITRGSDHCLQSYTQDITAKTL